MNNMPTINNGGQPYYFPADIAKEGEDYARLSNFFKTRVGDNGKILTLKWYDQGRVMNVHDFIPFVQGMVGKHYEESDTKEIVMAPDALYREWQGSTDNGHDGGFMDYILEDQMFPQEGIFKGHFGLKDTNGNVLTSVNIVFEVLGNDLRVGETTKYYSAELDRLAREYEVKTDQMVADGTQKVDQFVAQTKNDINASLQTSRDNLDALNGEIRANRAEQANISQHLAGTQQQIANYDIVTRPEFQNGMDTMNNAINERLSQMKTNPIAVANAGELTTNYPNGADGIFITADTGHKWIYLYGAWKDCGEYQAIGIENSELAPLKVQLQKQESKINQNTNDIGLNSLGIKNNTTRIQNIEGAGHLMDILLVDDFGNHITDDYGNRIGGYKWLPLTDVTLTQTGLPADGQAVGEAITDILDPHAERYDIPVLYLYSQLIPSLTDKSITLKNQVKYKFPKYGISGVLKKFKVQGRTSAGLPEKNYTLNFDKETTIFSDFGYQNKYVIKANYTDFSQAKNVVSAKVWGAVRHQHDTFETIQINADNYLTDEAGNHIQGICDPQLSISKTAGAIDGFPIALYVNDKFAGLYTFNIPKDDWMAKMPNKDGYAMVSVDWSNLDHQVDTTNTSDFGDVEIEFCGTKDTAWVQKSFNNMITALNQDYTDQSHFDMAIDPLLDLDSAIDYYCYSVLIDNIDGINSNFIFQTFDKTKWYIAAYDLDKTYGTTTDFETVIRPNSDNQNADLQQGIKHYGITFENMAKNSKLFSQLWKLHKDDVLNRTKELISTVMSPEEIACMFYDFTQKIPLALYNADAKRWSQKPYTSLLNSNQINLWYSQRINFIKQKYLNDKSNKGEK